MNDGTGDGYGGWLGYGYGYGDGSGTGYGDGSGSGHGTLDEREKIELNILKYLKDSELPLFINISWEFSKNKDLFERRLKGTI